MTEQFQLVAKKLLRKSGQLLLLLAISFVSNAQIDIDSLSRESPYGPFTTKYFEESQIKYNDTNKHHVDTIPNNFHRVDQVWKNNFRIQNLGNFGTALWPLYYSPPAIIGKTSGYNSYNLYQVEPDKQQYFDTRSPFSSVKLVLGGEQRSIVDVSFSRNITSLWNAGFEVNSISANKQINSAGENDRQSISLGYKFFSSFQSTDGKYHVLANLSRINHRVKEIGGIIPTSIDPTSNLFGYNRDAKIWLQNAESSQLKFNVHVYHHYKLNDAFQLYHVFDRSRELNKFDDAALGSEGDFFEHRLIDNSITADSSQFKVLQNEIGVKGDYANLFYSFYVKQRIIQGNQKYLINPDILNENYGGTYVRYRLTDSVEVNFDGELLASGGFKLKGQYRSKWLNVDFTSSASQPSYLVTDYFGNHGEWHNDFDNIKSQTLNGSLSLNIGNFHFSPNLSFSTISNYIYFDTNRLPAQADRDITIISPGVDLSVQFFKHIHFDAKAIYTTIGGGDADKMRIPEINAMGKLYFEDMIFNKVMWAQIGFDMHWQSSFFANDYDPSTQQFFLQNDFEVPSYLLTDVFISFKVKRFRWFFKLTNALQNVEAEGYFTTPYYTGQKRTFDIGINWMFFD